MNINSKIKIILVLVGFILFAGLMVWVGFGIIGNRNKDLADSVAKRRVDLEVLQREQKSFEQGKIDLAELAKSAYPPDELFSSDTKVVKEVQMLESISQKYGLEMTLSVNGTTDKATKVSQTVSDLYAVPYTITLVGSFPNELLFIQSAERLPFITHAQNVLVTTSSGDKANTVITSEFYIKK